MTDGSASRGPRVICVGLSTLDYIWQADRLPDAELSKVRARHFLMTGGGMAATAAVAIARLGGDARFWGRAGDDPAGHIMREELAAEGIDTSHFRLFEDAGSSVSGVFVDGGGERHIANFRGEGLPADAGWLPLSEISGAACVLSDPRWPEGTQAAFSAARQAGIPTVLDAEVAEPGTFEWLLPLTDHAIFSTPALCGFAGACDEAVLKDIGRSFGCRVAAVTRGEHGVVWREDGGTHRLPAFPVAVVDTNGAGDVFHGAYAFAIASGRTVGEAMEFASAAAALKCTRPIGRAGIPTLDEILRFQRTEA